MVENRVADEKSTAEQAQGDAEAIGPRNHTFTAVLQRAVLPTGDIWSRSTWGAFLTVMTWGCDWHPGGCQTAYYMQDDPSPSVIQLGVLGSSAEDQKLCLEHLALTFMEEALSLSE